MLECDFHLRLRSDENLPHLFETSTAFLVDLEFVLRPKVSQTGLAPEHFVPRGEITHECVEVLYPRIVASSIFFTPPEEIDCFSEFLLRDVESISIPPICIVEAKDIDRHLQLIFDIGNVRDPHRI